CYPFSCSAIPNCCDSLPPLTALSFDVDGVKPGACRDSDHVNKTTLLIYSQDYLPCRYYSRPIDCGDPGNPGYWVLEKQSHGWVLTVRRLSHQVVIYVPKARQKRKPKRKQTFPMTLTLKQLSSRRREKEFTHWPKTIIIKPAQ